ncbi:hypothetical protein PGT21_019460 [Puccinia graminis f. sp. tritici]|uniref:Uncharacterized protein n=1 Tax=Puccinia graminis f. sp. tritici TaxID=56615 RepID=A0A5B0QB70_PUCGR|nr:hypothetical protein PGT21_019460 [Puccinia graminis f. sp. tritici]KAA1134913.1 hypothetical protein PGTUg99_017350 [Puccinia graminis f. sp. tritici]
MIIFRVFCVYVDRYAVRGGPGRASIYHPFFRFRQAVGCTPESRGCIWVGLRGGILCGGTGVGRARAQSWVILGEPVIIADETATRNGLDDFERVVVVVAGVVLLSCRVRCGTWGIRWELMKSVRQGSK